MTFILILAWIMQSLAGQFFRVYFRIESIPTAAGRFEVWPLALDLISDKPIFGYGFGIEDKLLGLKGFVLHEHPGGYFHNSYLGMMLQLGILGFIIFFGPLFMLLFKELSLRQASQASLLRYALRASLMAGLICGIFESWLYSVGNTQTFPYWIMVMLLVFYRYQDKERGMV
jgi:O-antigen ligase